MYSVNAPVPPEVARLARGLAANCRTATPRDNHTLLVKRVGEDWPRAQRARESLAGLPPFQVRITGVETFARPTNGRGPVAYLAVESPGVCEAHERLCERFDPLPGLEGEDYVPHVTVARGGDADRLDGASVDPLEWTVERLYLWDPENQVVVENVSLPA